MGKADFDQDHIIMPRCLETPISETAHLEGCLRAAADIVRQIITIEQSLTFVSYVNITAKRGPPRIALFVTSDYNVNQNEIKPLKLQSKPL
ncbi:hypothetical protein TNCV_2975071 [Trichonephila clavipes]|nr:hypothetical protein TNCV_2975071 [Trichonephila clavipes]